MIEQITAVLADMAGPCQRAGRPFVTLSYAQSLDGCLASRPGRPLALSGPLALQLTHALRAGHDAILVGIGTVLADDPRLTVRLVDGRSPQPVIVDSHLRFPLAARLLGDGQRPPWIVTSPTADVAREAALTAAGARVLRLPITPTGQIDLTALLAHLHTLGIATLMVEGGARVITSFLAARLVDRVVVTVAPLLLGGQRAVGPLDQPAGACPPRLTNVRYHQLGADLIVRGDLAGSAS